MIRQDKQVFIEVWNFGILISHTKKEVQQEEGKVTVGNSQLVMPLHIPDARVQSLNLSREKDNKSTMSNYSMTLQEKRNAENSVTQMLIQKGEIDGWTVGDVSQWLEASGLVRNAPGLQEDFMKEKVDGTFLLGLTDEDLQDKFKIKSLGRRKNILRAVNYLKA